MDHLGGNTWKFDTRDLMRATSCRHCTAISVMRGLQIPQVLKAIEPFTEQETTLAQKYGNLYEDALTAELISSTPPGTVAEPELPERASMADRIAATHALMEAGVPIIYQGALDHATRLTVFRGKPDFLVHANWELFFEGGKLSARQIRELTGKPGYSAWDAKYASSPKPAYALQVALYISALEEAGWKAEAGHHGVILGGRTLEEFDEAEIVPAMLLARVQLDHTIDEIVAMQDRHELDGFLETFQWSCSRKSFCDLCEYPGLCNRARHEADDLVLVHNINGSQIEKLRLSGINSVGELASATDAQRPSNLDVAIFERLRAQAHAQTATKTMGRPMSFLLKDPSLQYLPPANPGDIFFDMEGFPYFHEKGGLEYLFGNWTPEGEFVDFWAHNRAEEADAFVAFMNWAVQRLNANPGAHIYHYASYEQSALRRLASRHSVLEAEVTALEQAGRFVDLATVVRKSLVIGQESYSIKYLEQYYGFKRTADVKKATDSVDGYDQWLELNELALSLPEGSDERLAAQAEASQILADLRLYNMEDVISTKALYDWLAGMEGACSLYGVDPDPKVSEAENTQSASAIALELLQEKTRALFTPLENWEWGVDAKLDEQARAWAALAHSILFYRREDVMYWADLYLRLEQDEAAMAADRKAEVLYNAILIETEPGRRLAGQPTLRLTYRANLDPEGLFLPKVGDKVIMRHSLRGGRSGFKVGEVLELGHGYVVLRRTGKAGDEGLRPTAILDYEYFNAASKQDALNTLADRIAAAWGNPALPAPEGFAALDLLLRRAPRFKENRSLFHAPPEDPLVAIMDSIANLDHSMLAIQGPPGAGKTYVASHTIRHLVNSGARVGVVTTSHKACENLIEACLDKGLRGEQIFKSNRTGDSSEKVWNNPKDTATLGGVTAPITEGVLIGGTAWTFSNPAVANKKFDYIFIDEAAQFSMVDALAVAQATKNLVLLGDPQQLPQVVTAIHPGGVENSALGHYMGEQAILPEDSGYFLSITHRLHPKINAPVSWLSYENKLIASPTTFYRTAEPFEAGLKMTPIRHQFNSTSSREEAALVLERIEDALGESNPLNQEDILVVSPYNAQVDLIRELLDEHGFGNVEVGTVDKFQGREAKVVLVSLAASSSEDAPRGLEFVLDRNRLNVAISRAQVACEIIFSSELLRANFQSLAELKAVGRFAGLAQFAND